MKKVIRTPDFPIVRTKQGKNFMDIRKMMYFTFTGSDTEEQNDFSHPSRNRNGTGSGMPNPMVISVR